MSKNPKEYLRHIYHECQFIVTACQDLSKSDFLEDEIIKRAITRSLEIIGEKFTPILCEVDFMTSNMAGLQLIRSGTIATGAKICDFRFKKEILKE